MIIALENVCVFGIITNVMCSADVQLSEKLNSTFGFPPFC